MKEKVEIVSRAWHSPFDLSFGQNDLKEWKQQHPLFGHTIIFVAAMTQQSIIATLNSFSLPTTSVRNCL
jgi:hypothetical protein